MGYHPRFERTDMASFQTTRTRNSELWFVNNNSLEEAILGYAAKYRLRYGVKLYALAIEGNHIQFPAHFPKGNRAHYMRDFNSSVARAVPRYVNSYPGGSLWARRYSAELVPGDEDVEEQFFYTVLQPIQDGLVERLSDYPGYNCFHDAIWGVNKKVTVIDWAGLYRARRWRKKVRFKDFIQVYDLCYDRLPGYEHLSQEEYAHLMLQKLEIKRQEVLAKRREAGHQQVAGKDALLNVKPGSLPKKTKTSGRYSHRPRVLAKSSDLLADTEKWYFDMYGDYQEASQEFRDGNLLVEFPPGSYRPPSFTALSPEIN